jgi:predicted dinucleotide-utilizing enzyme
MVETLALIGTGMIGGSIALACKKAGHVKKIIGYDTNPESLEASKALGICDSIEYRLEDAVKDADLVVFSMPVQAIAEAILRAAKCAKEGTVFTDTGSTKAEICSLVKDKLQGIIGFVSQDDSQSKEEYARVKLIIGKNAGNIRKKAYDAVVKIENATYTVLFDPTQQQVTAADSIQSEGTFSN